MEKALREFVLEVLVTSMELIFMVMIVPSTYNLSFVQFRKDLPPGNIVLSANVISPQPNYFQTLT